ncbi:MAG: carbohydrate kinase family protein [Caldilineaceae bacterium]
MFVHGERDAVHTGVLPVTPVDTTGAGDSFDAGFLYAFVNGLSLDECMRYGAVCGGLSTTGPGGISALPTLSEVELWLPKLPSSATAAPTHQD